MFASTRVLRSGQLQVLSLWIEPRCQSLKAFPLTGSSKIYGPWVVVTHSFNPKGTLGRGRRVRGQSDIQYSTQSRL